MLGARWHMTSVICLIGPLFGIVPAIRSDQPAPKPRVFLVPARAKVYDKKADIEENLAYIWIKRGGVVKARVNVALFFVEAGGTLEVRGNCFQVVAAEGATVTSTSRDHVMVHNAITIKQSERFSLTGTASGIDGKPSAGVKVHAYTLGDYPLASATTDAQGRFTITTDEEVSCLAADISPRWTDEKRLGINNTDLDLRQRLSPLQGWEVVIVRGLWQHKANVDLRLTQRAKVKLEEARTIPRPPENQSPYPELRFSPDGSLLSVLWGEVTRDKSEAQLWSVTTGKQLRTFALKTAWQVRGCDWSIFSPDGKLLALIGPGGIVLYKLPGGDKLMELPCQAGNHNCLAFSPDGNLLAEGGDRDITIWDLNRKAVRTRLKGHAAGTTAIAFSPDGKSLLSAGEIAVGDANFMVHMGEKLRLWDIATGKEIGTAPGEEGRLEYSRSGLILSAGDFYTTVKVDADTISSRREDFVSVADPGSKRELFRLRNRGRTAAFSADGRFVVTVDVGTVRFVEVATGQEALVVPLPDVGAPCSALAPGGKLLATSRSDGSILLWDLSWARLRVAETPLAFTDAARDQYWKELTGNAAGAYRVVWQLSKSPEQATEFLKSRLQPAPGQELPINKWLEELGSSQFKVREAASAELRKNGRAAEPALRAALKEKLPLEVQRRIELLLGELEARPLSTEELRQVRAITALEWIGTSEARQVLKTLAGGWSESVQTREAAAALRRLSR
jgi:WD40 repeat protein